MHPLSMYLGGPIKTLTKNILVLLTNSVSTVQWFNLNGKDFAHIVNKFEFMCIT